MNRDPKYSGWPSLEQARSVLEPVETVPEKKRGRPRKVDVAETETETADEPVTDGDSDGN